MSFECDQELGLGLSVVKGGLVGHVMLNHA